jgi:predicted sulfurtransferase
MNKLLKNIITPGVIITGLSLLPLNVNAEEVYSSSGSVLCYNQNLNTTIAVSMKGFNAAICSAKDNNNNYYYVGQSKNSNEKIFVSAQEISMKNGRKFRATNGSYTYQIVAICNPSKISKTPVTISVFRQGKIISQKRANRYMTNISWCDVGGC